MKLCFQSAAWTARPNTESVGVQPAAELQVPHQLSARPGYVAFSRALGVWPGPGYQRHHCTSSHREASALAPAARQEPRRQGC